ncbi:hypothetical protein [Helicobacter macacae]|uniref:hypothetical protein n=1 Tax=Helicobacter macacae TaxID=398626 RepID=UPI00041F288A|nr:hypothetical protein [Helicobacter macacae]
MKFPHANPSIKKNKPKILRTKFCAPNPHANAKSYATNNASQTPRTLKSAHSRQSQ